MHVDRLSPLHHEAARLVRTFLWCKTLGKLHSCSFWYFEIVILGSKNGMVLFIQTIF